MIDTLLEKVQKVSNTDRFNKVDDNISELLHSTDFGYGRDLHTYKIIFYDNGYRRSDEFNAFSSEEAIKKLHRDYGNFVKIDSIYVETDDSWDVVKDY